MHLANRLGRDFAATLTERTSKNRTASTGDSRKTNCRALVSPLHSNDPPVSMYRHLRAAGRFSIRGRTRRHCPCRVARLAGCRRWGSLGRPRAPRFGRVVRGCAGPGTRIEARGEVWPDTSSDTRGYLRGDRIIRRVILVARVPVLGSVVGHDLLVAAHRSRVRISLVGRDVCPGPTRSSPARE